MSTRSDSFEIQQVPYLITHLEAMGNGMAEERNKWGEMTQMIFEELSRLIQLKGLYVELEKIQAQMAEAHGRLREELKEKAGGCYLKIMELEKPAKYPCHSEEVAATTDEESMRKLPEFIDPSLGSRLAQDDTVMNTLLPR